MFDWEMAIVDPNLNAIPINKEFAEKN